MRVLHVMAGAAEGGAENIMLESVLALAEAGLAQHVVTRNLNPWRNETLRSAGVDVDTADFSRVWRFPTQQTLNRVIRSFAPDVIQYWMGRAGQFAPARHRQRSVAWYGGYYKLSRFTNCDWHVGLTTDLRRHIIEQGVAPDRADIIHTYADFPDAAPIDRAALDTPEHAPVALALARLHWKKGLDTLIDAAARIDGLYVWIAGEGPLEQELKAQAQAAGVAERIKFLGWRNDRAALLAACDVVAFPSRYEPFGTVTVDAWAAGKPIVAADAAGPKSVIADGVSGLVVPKDDVGALAGALQRVITSDALATSLVEGGYAAHAAGYTKAKFVESSCEFYARVKAASGS